MVDKETLDFVYDNCPCINLRKATRTTTRYFEEQLLSMDISVNNLIFLIVIGREDGVTQKQLAELLALHQSTLSRTIKDVQNKGWIKSEWTQENSKRVKKFTLSEGGMQKVEEATPVWVEGYQAFLENNSQEEWTSTLDRLNKIKFD